MPPFIHRLRQFSLGTFILLTITAGALVGYVISQRETNRLRSELADRRVSNGRLNIVDPFMVYVCEMPSRGGNNSWRWNVYFPRNDTYTLCVKAVNVPQTGISAKADDWESFSVSGGQCVIEATARRLQDGMIALTVKLPSGEYNNAFASKYVGFDDWMAGVSQINLPPEPQVECNPSDPIELIRIRATALAGQNFRLYSKLPCPGLHIWLERGAKPPPPVPYSPP